MFKRVGSFEEVAGEGVILIHRLLKNTVEHDEYLLLTEQADSAKASQLFPSREARSEKTGELGRVECVLYYPVAPPLVRPEVHPLTRPRAIFEGWRLGGRALSPRMRTPRRLFRGLLA